MKSFKETLLRLADEYDEDGGGGEKFRARVRRHNKVVEKTAAEEARVICKHFYPWRLKTPTVTG